jgi:hypothetical protein
MKRRVTRRSFLGSAVILSIPSWALATGKPVNTHTAEGTKPFKAKRVARSAVFDVDAPPGIVFPLLCPVREREWLDGWKADVLYSESGFAENNCVFIADNQLFGDALYAVSRYEPNHGRIECVIFFPGKCVQKLEIEVKSRAGGGTGVAWSRVYTGVNPAGNALIEQITETAFQQQMARIATSLRRYCRQLQGG